MPVSTSELSVDPVAFTKELENKSFLSGEDMSSMKVQLVLEGQFDDLEGTRNADRNSVDTVEAADNLNNLSPDENKNITCAIGMQHKKSDYGLQSSNIAAEDAITRSNIIDNSQHTVHKAIKEKNRQDVHSSGYSSMFRIRTLEEQFPISEIDCRAGTSQVEENDRCNRWDTLFIEDRTVKEAQKDVNESKEEFQASEASVRVGGVNLSNISENPVKGRTVVFDEKGSQISQEEEGGALHAELESSSKDNEQESLEDISVIFPGEHTNMIKKHRVSMLSDGLGSEKHMPLCKHTAEETKRHEDGQAKLNAIEFNRCSMSISNEIMEQSLYGQEKESERATVIKTEILVSHPVHPIHCHEDNDDGTAKKEDQKERASDVVKEPLRFSQDCMEESMQGIASTQHGCMEENMQGTASTQHCLEEGNGIPRSGFSSACKETKFPVSCEILIKDATRLLCPEERRPAQGEEIPKSALPVHQASSLRTDSLLTGSDKLVMDDSTCEDVATAQMKSKSDEFCIGSVDITVLKAESNKENQQLPLGEFPLPGGNEMTKFNTKDAVEGNRELTPETRAANASEIICSDAIPLEVNKPTRSEFVVKEQHRAAEEAVELKLNSEIGLGAHHAVSEDNVHPDSLKELDLERHEGIFEERASEDVQSLESSCCHVNSLEASFHYVALEDEAVKRTQSSERSTQLKTPENKGGISPFNSDGCQQENPCYSCLEDEFKLHHDQAGKVAVSIRQTEWTQAHNSAAIKLDRCSMPCVAVESEWCTTDRVVMDANDVKGGNVNKTHEDTEDYSMNNHAMEMQKSEDGTNLRLSNLAPFSCPKDLRDLDGDIEAPPQCSEETNCDFDCQEDEEIQLDQHRYMHSYGLSCIKLRTRSAETNVGDESESSEESLLHDTGNPEIEDCVDVTNNDTALDSTGDTKYESDDLVRVEEDVPRKIDQSPVTAGEEPMLLRELSSDLKCKDQYSMEGSLLAERSEKIETGDESKAPTEDTVSNSTEKKSDGNEESGSNCVMTTELHDLSKLDGLPDSVSDPNRITCHADCLLKQGSRTGLPAILSAETSSNNETKLVEVHDKPQCQFDNPRKMIEHKHEKRLEDNIIGNDGDVTELEFDENAPLVAEGLENKHMEILEEHEKGLQDINAGDACDMVVLEFEENALLVSEGLEDEHKQKKAEESVDPIVPFDGFISAEKFEEHEKGLQDANAGYGGHLVALEFKENALLVAEEPGDEHKHNKAEEFVDPIAPLDWSSSGEKMQEYGKGLQDANAGDVVALEFEENSLLVAEGLTHEHKEVEESVNPNVSSDGFISGEKSEEHEKRLQDTSTEDGCHIVASEFKENALVVAEGLEDEHKEDKRAEESVAHLDGFISGEKLEEHDKVLQDANAGDGDVVASKFEENAPLVAEGLEYKHKEVEDSVNFNVPPDGYISVFGERLEDHEKRWEDVNAEDDGHVVALEFKENALLVAEGLEGEHKDKRAEETVDPTALVDGFISREKLEEHEKVLQVTNAGDGGDIVSSEFEENALLISEGPKDEHKHNQTEESTDPTAPSDGFILGEMLEEHEKRFQDTNAGDGGNVVALEFEENALLVAEGPEDEHKNKKAGECVNHIAPSDWFSSGEKLEEKEINNFRNEKRECPEDSVSYEGSVNKIKGRDAGALVEQESRSMTPLFGESELYSGMLNVEEHRIEEEVAEDIGSIKNSVDVLDLGGHEVSREQDDIYAMIQEYMDLEHQKADFGDIFVSQDIVHDDCGSYNAPTDKPIFESEQNESREEIPFHSAGADNSSLGDDGSIKHSIEQTTHLPIICTKNVNHDLAAMNISAMNDDDNMARKSSMKQPKFSSCQKNRSESNLDGSKKAALLMKSATVRRVKSRGNPIDKTPKKLLSTFEMKENMPSTKKEQISSTTATKTLTKRRALEDLRKKPIWK